MADLGDVGMLSQRGTHLTLEAAEPQDAEADPGRSFFVQSPQVPVRSALPALDLSGVTPTAGAGVDFSERGSSLPALPTKRLFGDEAPAAPAAEESFAGVGAAPVGGLGGLFGLPLETSQLQLSSEPVVVLPQATGLNDYDSDSQKAAPRGGLAKSAGTAFPHKGKQKQKATLPQHGQGRAQAHAGALAGAHAGAHGGAHGGLQKPKKAFEDGSSASAAFPKVVLPPISKGSGAPSETLLDHLEGLPSKKPGVPGMAGVFSDEQARPILRAKSAGNGKSQEE